jgi:asparagine synthase (glutamine-hydrolysing)
LLSGGIDSSLVCWAINKLGGDVTAYTVGTPGHPWDESVDARRTARALRIRHEVLNVDASEDPDIEELVFAYGEPFACASALGMLKISRAVSATAKVLLTGDGGDDVFLGYPGHRHLWMAEYVAHGLPSGTWWQAIRGAVPRIGPLRRVVSFMDFATGGLAGIVRAHDGLPMYAERRLLGPRLHTASIDQRSIPLSHISAKHVLTEFLEHDRNNRFVSEYMTKVDGATMHYGLEARSPFLDQELWEFAASLPFGVRLRHGRLKAVLRTLAARTVGTHVANGRKRGFGIPVQRWITGRWRAALDNSFQDSLLDKEGWIIAPAVRRELAAAAQVGWAPKQLWYLFVLESWLRHERSTPAAMPSHRRALA